MKGDASQMGMHGKGGCAWQEGVHGMVKRGVCGKGGVVKGACMAGGMHGREHAWWGTCMAGGVYGRRDGHCSRRYASYWNAFLFLNKNCHQIL